MSNEEHTTRGYLAVPTANLEIENRLPLVRLEMVADAHAHEIWGEEVARGQALPLANANGDLEAFLFPYLRGSTRFPEFEQIFETFGRMHKCYRELAEAGNSQANQALAEIHWEASRYGSIYVSATRANFPILMIAHYLHPYFLLGESAQVEAERLLESSQARLHRLYHLGLHEEYFEFTTHDHRLLLNVDSLEQRPSEVVLAIDREAAKPLPTHVQQEIESVWDRALSSAPRSIDADKVAKPQTNKRILHWELVPEIVHTYWCVPTSHAMILGFWDNYVKGKGTVSGYGRLIGYWFEHHLCHNPVTGRNVICSDPGASLNNVPDLIDKFMDPNTNGWRTDFNKDKLDFIKKTYDYDFQHEVIKNVSADNDWAWQELKGDVDAGRPMLWSYGTHSVVSIGYRITNTGQKMVICLDTYGTSLKAKLMEHDYSKCIGYERFVPGGGTGKDHLIIGSPDGGETLSAFDACDITWFVWGKKIKKTTISFSSNGGRNWTPIASNVSAKPGWNSLAWTPKGATNKGRIRIQGYTTGDKYIAGDGSQTNFKVEPAPIWEVEKYQVGWNHDSHCGVVVLQFKDGGFRKIEPLLYESYMSFIDTLRNEKPLWYDENQALLLTFHEPVGEEEA